jgi:hypothetical protein
MPIELGATLGATLGCALAVPRIYADWHDYSVASLATTFFQADAFVMGAMAGGFCATQGHSCMVTVPGSQETFDVPAGDECCAHTLHEQKSPGAARDGRS